MSRGQALVLACCLLAVIASAMGVVYAKYSSRKLFRELEALRVQRDELDIEWGRLQLEIGTLASHGRVERLAREKLNMKLPQPEDVVVVKP